jgi:hypothetical protein
MRIRRQIRGPMLTELYANPSLGFLGGFSSIYATPAPHAALNTLNRAATFTASTSTTVLNF